MNKEQVYDEQISPLIAQILTICKANKIAMLADFHLGDNLKCTSVLLTDEYDPTQNMLLCLDILKPRGNAVAFVTTRDASGNVINSTALIP